MYQCTGEFYTTSLLYWQKLVICTQTIYTIKEDLKWYATQ